MTGTLQVFKGESTENITITTIDRRGKAVDTTWASASTTILEIKDKSGGTVIDTLTTSDFVNFTVINMVVKGDKFYALDNGKYFGKLTLKDDGTRKRILTFNIKVSDV